MYIYIYTHSDVSVPKALELGIWGQWGVQFDLNFDPHLWLVAHANMSGTGSWEAPNGCSDWANCWAGRGGRRPLSLSEHATTQTCSARFMNISKEGGPYYSVPVVGQSIFHIVKVGFVSFDCP